MFSQTESKSQHYRVGFTLVELLVVVSGIALLISFTLPSVYMAKEEAKRVVCASQLNTIGKTTHMYQQDNDGAFPEFFYDKSPGASNTIVILVKPKPFAKSGLNEYHRDVIVCPSDPQPGTVPVRMPDDSIENRPMSYGYNIDFLLRDQRYDDIRNTSETLFFYDGSMSGPNAGGKNIQGHYHGATDFVNESIVHRHVNDQANLLFADTHVTSVNVTEEIPERFVLVGGEPIGTGGGQSDNNGGGNNGGGNNGGGNNGGGNNGGGNNGGGNNGGGNNGGGNNGGGNNGGGNGNK